MTPRIRSLMAALVLAMAAPTLSAAAPRHAVQKGSFVTIPRGTTLNVRLAEPIHVNFTRPGATYNGVLDRSVSMRRAVLIPRGALVRLRAVDVNRFGQSDRVLLTARAVSFGGRTYRISTSDVQARGRRVGRGPVRRAVGGKALGGAAGAVAGGAPGAAVGAAVGGTSGVMAGSRAGERVRISANTRFQFRLNDSLTVRH
jgi:hypothetical protein